MARLTIPPGRYFLGDPCYVIMTPARWDQVTHMVHQSRQGLGGVVTIEGERVIAWSTGVGDGLFPGSDYFEYSVDSGLIGLVPWELCEPAEPYPNRVPNHELGRYIQIPEPIKAERFPARLRFGSISIGLV